LVIIGAQEDGMTVGSLIVAAALAAGAGSLESTPEVHVVSFEVPAGTVYVNLPGDLAPGDRASATVNPVPSGKTAKDQARHGEELAAFSVQLGAQPAAAGPGVRTFDAPAAGSLPVVLTDKKGKRVGEVRVPLRAPAAAPTAYAIPAVGQGGGAFPIAGAFDGDLSNSEARIGGTPAQPMAESPRQLVVRGPQDGMAATPVEVRERGQVVATGTYRNVSVKLAAPTTHLLSGQRTTLTVTLGGLHDLKETLPVRLTNASPGVASMEGGNEQTLCVRADEVKADGTWTRTRGLTGVRPGGFAITTEVARASAQAGATTRAEATLKGEMPARLQLEREARAPSGEALAPGFYTVLVRGTGEKGAVNMVLLRGGKTAATVPGVVMKRETGGTLCDMRDAADAADRASEGTGERRLDELGFEEGSSFAVRDDGPRPRLVLETKAGVFSVEGDLAPR
jgi:hypothetical protein